MIRGPTIIRHLELFLNKLSSCFGEKYRDLLRYLHQKLDENNSNRQVHTAVQQYIQKQFTILCSHVAPNSVLFAESVDITSFCGACLNFSREKDSAIPFPRRL